MKFFTKEVQIACVAIVALVVLYWGLNFLKGLSIFSKIAHLLPAVLRRQRTVTIITSLC